LVKELQIIRDTHIKHYDHLKNLLFDFFTTPGFNKINEDDQLKFLWKNSKEFHMEKAKKLQGKVEMRLIQKVRESDI
jgi:hypothetical protein